MALCEPTNNDNKCLNECLGETGQIQVNFTLSSEGFGNPTAIRFGRFSDDNPLLPQRMFIANQDGRIMFSDQSDLKNGPLTTMINFESAISTTVNHFGAYAEAGLLGLELHPKFHMNGRFYVWYSIPRTAPNVTNTPNCSFTGGYGPAGPSKNKRNFGVDRTYDPDVYKDLLVLEEYVQLSSLAVAPTFVRRMITQKHFFTNHYGINNLMFEENGKLLVVMSDGGCFFDQYGVAQNRAFMNGKIVSVDVDANSLYIPIAQCTTPTLLWTELQAACPTTYKIFTLYASGVRNFGHMSMDIHEGKINRFVVMVGQNRAESLYSFAWESNFGWYRRENRLCSCIVTDPLRDPQCDFNQTIAECMDETSISGAYTYPMMSLNQANDHVSSVAGGFVYRGTELPCGLQGVYIWGDWSTKDMFTPGFPAPFNGTLQLFHVSPNSNNINTNQNTQENSHGKILIGGGLTSNVNYLASWGYDYETNRIYMGVQGMIPPYNSTTGNVSTLGQIYILTSPVKALTPTVANTMVCYSESLFSKISHTEDMTIAILVLVVLAFILLLVSAISYLLGQTTYRPNNKGGNAYKRT